jgi:hypothetical protein
MPGAESIASHGRTKKVSDTTLASLGRLHKAVEELIDITRTEIISLISRVLTVLNIESRVDDS